jgi:pyruvate/2-oxoglutarate dehydrogenase complex dihydrolipoamide dehydrogenase (E3) component
MTAARAFDAIVVGAGQAGPPLAARLARSGMTVALVERDRVGGTCVNTGCMPTKTLVASARVAHQARRAADYGVNITGAIEVDLMHALTRARTVTRNARAHIEASLEHLAPRCTFFHGHATFVAPRQLRVGDELITAEHIFLDVGGRPLAPPMPGVDVVPFLTSSTLLACERLPARLIVIGGGYVGLEFAQIYRRFGSEVTLVEKGPRIATREDEEVSAALRSILEREGIVFRLEAECIALSRADRGVRVHLECATGDREVIGTHVLLAVGRKPNTDDLGLQEAGVAVDRHGFILVDDHLRTTTPGIWALGECNGHGAFTHTAYNDFEIVASNVLDHKERRLSDRIPAYALYTDPPLGRAGLTETEARRTGRPLLVGTYPMSQIGRAIEKGETEGFMKVIVDAETKQLLGAAVLGTGGDEIIHELLDSMYAGATTETLRRTVGIHPTVSELIPTMLGELRPAG